MNIVDSSAWLSYLAGDADAGKLAKAIEDLEQLLVPGITLAQHCGQARAGPFLSRSGNRLHVLAAADRNR